MKPVNIFLATLGFIVVTFCLIEREVTSNLRETKAIPSNNVTNRSSRVAATKLTGSSEETNCKADEEPLLSITAPFQNRPPGTEFLMFQDAPNEALVAAVNAKNPSAIIAFFVRVRSCLPIRNNIVSPEPMLQTFSSTDCDSIPPAIRQDAFQLLGNVAQSGDIAAQLTFTLNAPMEAIKVMKSGDADAAKNAQLILARARSFGEAAARRGNLDALRLMAQSYLTGSLGSKDLEHAYAYLLVLNRVGTEKHIRSAADSVRAQLTEAQMLRASNLAFGCKSRTGDNILRNPFQ